MTNAELKLSKCGFHLRNKDIIKIDENLSYPYLRYVSKDTICDMTIEFDPSQYAIYISGHEDSRIIADPKLLEAILDRTKELNY